MKSWKIITGALLVLAGYCAGVGLNFKPVQGASGPPEPPPVALKTVTHDATLTGNGTEARPLGIADGGVSAHKLSTSTTPTAGQILGFNGNLAWQNAPVGGMRVVDSLGHDVGPAFITGSTVSVMRRIGALTFQLQVDSGGVLNRGGFFFFHTSPDCSGSRYLASTNDLIRNNQSTGAELLYPSDPIQQVQLLSMEVIGGPDPAQPGQCIPNSQSILSGVVARFDLSTLGLVPPFHLEF